MTFTTTNRPMNDGAPTRLHAPGAVTHEDRTPMSTTHGTAPTSPIDSLSARLLRLEAKLDAVIERLDGGAHDERIGDTLERIEDQLVDAAIASTRRDRLILVQLAGAPERQPAHVTPAYNLCDAEFALDLADALLRDTASDARDLVARGGVLPITIADDGGRRA